MQGALRGVDSRSICLFFDGESGYIFTQIHTGFMHCREKGGCKLAWVEALFG